MAFARPKLIPLFISVCGFGLTVALGTWQVERLHWKEGLIASIKFAREQGPLETLPKTEDELVAKKFYYVHLRGTWVPNVEFDLTPRYYDEKLGYWIINPLTLADGRTVLVNRGWVPADRKELAKRPETKVSGAADLTGMIRTGNERNWFMPKNEPTQNLWFGRDTAEMGDYAHLKNVAPVMVDVVGEQDEGKLPIPSDGQIKLRNDHLSYILTWYGIAAGILVIFLTYHWEKPKRR